MKFLCRAIGQLLKIFLIFFAGGIAEEKKSRTFALPKRTALQKTADKLREKRSGKRVWRQVTERVKKLLKLQRSLNKFGRHIAEPLDF
jgi:hypothetical protein